MSDNPSWSETQAKLLKDIDAFARSKPDLSGADEPAKVKRPAAPQATAAAPRRSASAEQPAAPAAPPPVAPASGGSLLDKLKREAQARSMTDSQRLTLQQQQKRFISDALQRAYQYFSELSDHLNVIKPPLPLEYSLLSLATFDELSWQEGRADYRLLPQATDERLVEQVTLRYRLAAPRQLRVERESPTHEAFAAKLAEFNVRYEVEETRNARKHVERAVFTFPCELRAGFSFTADYQRGDIRLVMRNVRRFGGVEYRLSHEALDQGTLEEMARFIMGEESRFEKMFRRVA